MNLDFSIWHYFLALEADFHDLSRYVEIHENNFSVYSAELTKLILSSAVEFESVAKKLIREVNPCLKKGNIADIKRSLLSLFPKFFKNRVSVDHYKVDLYPFKDWEGDSKLKWWEAYKRLKHDRVKNYSEGTLKNAMDTLAALGVCSVYYFKVKYKFEHLTGTKLLTINGMGEYLCAKPSTPIPDKI